MGVAQRSRYPGHIWTPKRQPIGDVRVDWSHPLAGGLLAAWLPRGNVLRDVTRRGGDIGPNNNPAIVVQAGGLAATDASSGQHHWRRTLPDTIRPTAAVTLMWHGEVRDAGTTAINGTNIIGASYDNADGNPYTAWALFRSNTNPVDGGFNWNNGSFQNVTFSSVYTTGRRLTVVASLQLGGNVAVYVDGAAVAGPTSASSGTIAYSSTAPLMVGCHPTNFNNNAGCGVELGAVWNRALTQAEAAWLSAEPYSFLLPAG